MGLKEDNKLILGTKTKYSFRLSFMSLACHSHLKLAMDCLQSRGFSVDQLGEMVWTDKVQVKSAEYVIHVDCSLCL